METAHKRAAKHPGMLIASATSLVLAVELYLKALHIVAGQIPPKSHDLSALFDSLPEWVRQDVLADYARIEKPAGGIACGLDLELAVNAPSNTPDSETDGLSELRDHSLPAVLERSKDAFKTWRYLYEQGDPAGPVIVSFEFGFLDVAATALRRSLVEVIQQLERGRANVQGPSAE